MGGCSGTEGGPVYPAWVGIAELDALTVRGLNQQARKHPLLRTLIGMAARQLASVEILLMLALAVSGKRGTAVRMFVGVGVVYVACELMGAAWPRGRPFERDQEITPLLAHDTGRSFPSRHVASGVAMAVIGGAAHPKLGWVMAGVAYALGATRVAAGVHYPSDVLGGALLGRVLGYGLRT